MALPTAAVITKKITLPATLRDQEMEIQVESEANQYLPFALEEVNLDFQVIGPAPGNPDDVEVLLAASRKEKVEDRVAAAEVAELKPVVMDVEAYATEAAYELVTKQLPGEGAGQIVALVDVGASAMKITIMKDDQQLYTREQAFGGVRLPICFSAFISYPVPAATAPMPRPPQRIPPPSRTTARSMNTKSLRFLSISFLFSSISDWFIFYADEEH